MKLKNTYYLLRHGQALSNVQSTVSSWPEIFENPLTEKGREQAFEAGKKLKDKQIDIIIASDILRAKETAEIVAREIGLSIDHFDQRLREVGFGQMNGASLADFNKQFGVGWDRIDKSINGSETYEQVTARMWDFLEDTEKKYQGKRILVVSHESTIWLLLSRFKGLSIRGAMQQGRANEERVKNGEFKELISRNSLWHLIFPKQSKKL